MSSQQDTQGTLRRGRSAPRGAKGAKTDSPAPRGEGGAGDETEPIPAPRADSAGIKALNAGADAAEATVEQRPSPKRSAASPKDSARGREVGECSLCSLRRRECAIARDECAILREQLSDLEERGGDPAREDERAQREAERREAEWEQEKEDIRADRARAQEREEQTRRELEATRRDLDEVLEANEELSDQAERRELELTRITAAWRDAEQRCKDLANLTPKAAPVIKSTQAPVAGTEAVGEEQRREGMRQQRMIRFSTRSSASDRLMATLRQEADVAVEQRAATLPREAEQRCKADRARAQEREEQTRWELEATLRDRDALLGANERLSNQAELRERELTRITAAGRKAEQRCKDLANLNPKAAPVMESTQAPVAGTEAVGEGQRREEREADAAVEQRATTPSPPRDLSPMEQRRWALGAATESVRRNPDSGGGGGAPSKRLAAETTFGSLTLDRIHEREALKGPVPRAARGGEASEAVTRVLVRASCEEEVEEGAYPGGLEDQGSGEEPRVGFAQAAAGASPPRGLAGDDGEERRADADGDENLGIMGRAALAKASGRAASIDRASAPPAEHPWVTSAALLDDGTPAARHARAAEQHLALLAKRNAEDEEGRKLKEEKMSLENPNYATRAEQIRFQVLRTLGNGRCIQTTKGDDGKSHISLRAGGASAMYHAGFSAEEIQRRGRWAIDRWKRYVHAGRTKAKDTAERMAKADFQHLRTKAKDTAEGIAKADFQHLR